MSAKTCWFYDGKPTHADVYERMFSAPFSFFDGKSWRWSCDTAKEAFEKRASGKSNYQNLPWRGLEENPNKDK